MQENAHTLKEKVEEKETKEKAKERAKEIGVAKDNMAQQGKETQKAARDMENLVDGQARKEKVKGHRQVALNVVGTITLEIANGRAAMDQQDKQEAFEVFAA
jgi:lipid A disaccharide synthetase